MFGVCKRSAICTGSEKGVGNREISPATLQLRLRNSRTGEQKASHMTFCLSYVYFGRDDRCQYKFKQLAESTIDPKAGSGR
jgi:hypothetical protein